MDEVDPFDFDDNGVPPFIRIYGKLHTKGTYILYLPYPTKGEFSDGPHLVIVNTLGMP